MKATDTYQSYIIIFPNSPDQIACVTGEYSLAKSTSCTVCPAGYSCATTSASPSACAAGTYSLGGNTSCTDCEAGYACPSTSSLTNRYPCPSGKIEIKKTKFIYIKLKHNFKQSRRYIKSIFQVQVIFFVE